MVTTLLQYVSFRRQGCTDDMRDLMTAVLLGDISQDDLMVW